MLKHTCMYLGAHYCHRLISTLCVGDTMVLITLGAIAVCETFLIVFLCHAWNTRPRHQTAKVRTRTYRLRAPSAPSANLDASPS